MSKTLRTIQLHKHEIIPDSTRGVAGFYSRISSSIIYIHHFHNCFTVSPFVLILILRLPPSRKPFLSFGLDSCHVCGPGPVIILKNFLSQICSRTVFESKHAPGAVCISFDLENSFRILMDQNHMVQDYMVKDLMVLYHKSRPKSLKSPQKTSATSVCICWLNDISRYSKYFTQNTYYRRVVL